MVTTNRIHSRPLAQPTHKPLTPSELKQGLKRISESGYQDAHPVKGNLPLKVLAGLEKAEPNQSDVTEFYQLTIKGHGVFISVTGAADGNHLHAFDPTGKALLSGKFKTDGEPVKWK